jgi:hypothetical protein
MDTLRAQESISSWLVEEERGVKNIISFYTS